MWGGVHRTEDIPFDPDWQTVVGDDEAGYQVNDVEYNREGFLARNFRRLRGIGLVRDEDHSQEEIKAALQRDVPTLLRQLPKVNTVDGMKHKIAIDSDCVWVWDETAPIIFSQQVFRHLYGEGPPVIETLLGRPLLGVPHMYDRMYARQGLTPLATMDLRHSQNCIVAQIVGMSRMSQVHGRVRRRSPVIRRTE
jgi:hypothetical protein